MVKNDMHHVGLVVDLNTSGGFTSFGRKKGRTVLGLYVLVFHGPPIMASSMPIRKDLFHNRYPWIH